ncbi:MAG: SsrA-binding protein SmpB [Chloroflexi bacterium]|nr:SsrA-binding protein SmpB [Chloroflexota bacterium]
MAQINAKEGIKVVATNRKATHDYFISDRFEAGLVLRGSEIKSIRAGQVNLRESYVREERGEMWLVNAHIAVYDPASRDNHAPTRPRKLLLHRKEIARLLEKAQQKGLTIVPLRLYLSKGRAKIEIALAKGKRQYDKRQAMAKRDSDREIARALAAKSK